MKKVKEKAQAKTARQNGKKTPIPPSQLNVAALNDEQALLTSAVELLFFAYRDFIADPDTILKPQNLGRAHHRALHFIGRMPGISVTELLGVLGVTKQSLGRILHELIEDGHVVQSICTDDRRRRLLTLTRKGNRLLSALLTPQHERFTHALNMSDAKTFEAWKIFTSHLINPEYRDKILDRVKP